MESCADSVRRSRAILARRIVRRALAVALATTCASSANAEDPAAAVHPSARQGARAKAPCAAPAKKCGTSAARGKAEGARIIPVVTDDSGTPVVDVLIEVDGTLWTNRLDGHALSIDPGLHELSFRARVGPWPGREVSTTQTIRIAQGQRGTLAVSLPAPDLGDSTGPLPGAPVAAESTGSDDLYRPDGAAEGPQAAKPGRDTDRSRVASPPQDAPPAPRSTGSGPSVFAYLLGGVGALGVGGGALLTYWGKTDNAALSQCAPNCASSSVDHIRRLYLAADLSFGAGGAALGVATLLFFTSGSSEGAKATPLARAASAIDVRPTPSGAIATLQGVF